MHAASGRRFTCGLIRPRSTCTVEEALLIIDVQNDFCEGGALAVPGADTIVPVLNRYIRLFVRSAIPVFFSRDWHPRRTTHFSVCGGSWPAHCIMKTGGARFHKNLLLPGRKTVVSKGMDPGAEGYSALGAVNSRGQTLTGIFRKQGLLKLYIGGLATDFCVKHTALEALKGGYRVTILSDAVRAVTRDGGLRALGQMKKNGARFARYADVARTIRTHRRSGAKKHD